MPPSTAAFPPRSTGSHAAAWRSGRRSVSIGPRRGVRARGRGDDDECAGGLPMRDAAGAGRALAVVGGSRSSASWPAPFCSPRCAGPSPRPPIPSSRSGVGPSSPLASRTTARPSSTPRPGKASRPRCTRRASAAAKTGPWALEGMVLSVSAGDEVAVKLGRFLGQRWWGRRGGDARPCLAGRRHASGAGRERRGGRLGPGRAAARCRAPDRRAEAPGVPDRARAIPSATSTPSASCRGAASRSSRASRLAEGGIAPSSR